MTGTTKDDKGWPTMIKMSRDDWNYNDDDGPPGMTGMTMDDLKDDKGWPGMTRADQDD